jgi:prevent-host-death family protein
MRSASLERRDRASVRLTISLDSRITGDTVARMDTVTIRELRNRGGEVVDRVEAGGHVTVTRDGRPVAELRPLRTRGLSAGTLLERWHRLPTVDPAGLRNDVDSVVEPGQ